MLAERRFFKIKQFYRWLIFSNAVWRRGMIPGLCELDVVGRFATRLMPTAAPQVGRIALVGSGSALQQFEHFIDAKRLAELSADARALAEEVKRKAGR